MTGVRTQHAHEDWLLCGLSLPGHVLVMVGGSWRRGWLIGRDNGPGGWTGVVMYDDDTGREVTETLPAARITSPDIWVTGQSAE